MERARPTLDPNRQSVGRTYSRLRRRLALGESIALVLYLSLWVVSGASLAVSESLRSLHVGVWPTQTLAVALLVGGPWFVLTLPLAYYAGYILPHRFGQSNQTLRLWFIDQAKGLLLTGTLGCLVVLGVYAAMDTWPSTWWIVVGLGVTAMVALISALSPVLLMPMFYKLRPLQEHRADLVQRLSDLAGRAGQQVRGVFSFDMSRRTKDANAALVGMGRTRRILLGDTLLDDFTDDEIETVLAHELGHHVHRDLRLGLAFQAAAALVILGLASAVLQIEISRSLLRATSDPAGLPTVALVTALSGMILAPAQNAFSRWRERRADEFAVGLTGRPRAFADAMTRLANQNLADADPPRWAVILFGTHPPLRERIDAAEAAAGAAPRMD